MSDDLRLSFSEKGHSAFRKEKGCNADVFTDVTRDHLCRTKRRSIDAGGKSIVHIVKQPKQRVPLHEFGDQFAQPVGLCTNLLHDDVFSVQTVKLLIRHIRVLARDPAKRFVLCQQPDGDIIAVGENAFRLKLQSDRLSLRQRGQELRAELFQRLPPFGEHAFAALLPRFQPKAGIDHGNGGGFDRLREDPLFPHKVRQRIDIIAPLYRVGLIADGSTHILVEPADSLLGVVPVKGALVLEFQVLRRVVSPDACAPGTHAFTPLSA